MKSYIPRLVDAELERGLRASGAVEICGPRACGKTETARHAVNAAGGSQISLDVAGTTMDLLRSAPGQILLGDTPRLIDEWQSLPQIWNLVRHEIDDRRRKGQFILTGSSTPEENSLRHSGAGRIRRLTMRTMSLYERGLNQGNLSLASLFEGTAEVRGEVDASVTDYISWMASGGWPGFLGLDTQDAADEVAAYIEQIEEHDYPIVGGMRRDPRRFGAFLRAYAGLIAQPATFAAVRRRIGEISQGEPSEQFVPLLHDFACRLFLVEDQPAWSPRLRSKAGLVQTPKRHLADVSLAMSLLGGAPERFEADPETLGILFESLVVHELRVYAQSIRARGVFHLRDGKGRLEIDAIIESRSGDWIGVEAKLSHLSVDEAAANLLRVASHIERSPSALVVVIPSGPVVRRRDGVWVVPLAALQP